MLGKCNTSIWEKKKKEGFFGGGRGRTSITQELGIMTEHLLCVDNFALTSADSFY